MTLAHDLPRSRPAPEGLAAPHRARRLLPGAVVLAYALLALAAYWPLWPGDPSRMPLCPCSDPAQGAWFLGWIPYALGHLQNPFFTHLMDYPVGANLAQNTEMPLLGLLTAPLTLAVSPVASFNLVMWLAYPLSASSMYLVARRLVSSEGAAAATGLLYGFSAYVVGEGYGHPNLSFVPLPPVLLYLVFDLVVRQQRPPVRQGLLLGAIVTAQFLISPEVLSTTVVCAVLGVALLALARPRELTRARVAHAGKGLVIAAVLAGALLAYPVWFLVAGPHRYHGPIQGFGNPYRADLLGPVVPTPADRLAPAAWRAFGGRFVAGTFAENGSYLGAPLLLAAAALAWRFRSNRWLAFLAAMAGIAFVLSLGPRLIVGGHRTGVPLPFSFLVHLPLLGNVLPSRISLYQDTFVALLVGVGLDQLLSARRKARARTPLPRQRHARRAGLALGALVAAAPLVPAWPEPTFPLGIPALFTSARVAAIPANSVVLTYPLAVSPDDQAMLWQAVSGYRFRLIGGYAVVPDAQGGPSPWPPELAPVAVQAALGYEALGPAGYLTAARPVLGGPLTAAARTYLRRQHVDAVVADPALGNNGPLVARWLTQVLGAPPRRIGGALLWRDVPSLLRRARR